MRKIALILALLLASFAASADKTASPEAPANAVPSFGKEPWQQCLAQLCGDDVGQYLREINAHANSQAANLWAKYSDIKWAAEAAARADAILEKPSLEKLLQMIRTNQQISNPKSLEVIVLANSISRIKDMEIGPDYKLDERKTRAKMIASGVTDVDAAVQTSRVYLDVLLNRPKILSEPLELLRERYSDDDLKKQLIALTKEIERAEIEVSSYFGLNRSAAFSGLKNWQAIKARLETGTLNPADLETLDERYLSPIMLSRLLKTGVYKRSGVVAGRTLLDEGQVKLAESRLADLNKATAVSPSGTVDQVIRDIGYSCLGHAGAADLFFPTKKQVSEFMHVEKKFRTEFLDQLSPRLSAETMTRLRPKIQGLRAVAGRTIENWRENLLAKLNESKDSSEEEISAYQGKDQALELSALFTVNDFKQPDDEYSIGKDVQEICASAGNALSDEADMQNEIVNVGAISVRDPDANRGVIFHEYGHLTRSFLRKPGSLSEESRGKFESWEKCLKDAHGGSDKYLEEDFADMLAANFDKNRKKVICRRNSFDTADSFTVKDPQNDSHSTELFRILHWQLVQEQIPPVCQEALQAKGESFNMKRNCMSSGEAAAK